MDGYESIKSTTSNGAVMDLAGFMAVLKDYCRCRAQIFCFEASCVYSLISCRFRWKATNSDVALDCHFHDSDKITVTVRRRRLGARA